MKLSEISPDEVEVVSTRAPLRLSDINPEDIEDGSTSLSEDIVTGARNFAQGGTFGLSDEIAGGVEAAGRMAGLKGLGVGNITDISLAEGGPTWRPGELSKIYSEARDRERGDLKTDMEKSPVLSGASQFAGAVASPISRIGKTATLGKAMTTGVGEGALAGLGYTEADDAAGIARDIGAGGVIGGAGGALGKAAEKGADIVTPYIKNLIAKSGEGLKDVGGKLFEKATGATGRQVEKFQDGAGRKLLESGNFPKWSSPDDIAKIAQRQLDESGARIDDILVDADASGTKIDLVEYLESAEKKIRELREAGLFKEAKSLEARTMEVVENANSLGKTEFKPSVMENVKRESQADINYQADTKPAIAGKKAAASMQRELVEDAVGATNPAARTAFEEDKALYGLYAPVQEAAQKRANTLNQSPIGGLLDVATGTLGSSAIGAAAGYGGSGDLSGALTGAGLAAVGRRYVAPRIASRLAYGFHDIGEMVQRAPQMFGKYAPVLQNAAKRGPQGLASTNFLLQQTDPEYRILLNHVAGNEQTQGDENAFNP